MVPPRSSLLGLLLVLVASTSAADVVSLTASKDNTLYESVAGSFSNGQGSGMFVGRTAGHFPDPPFLRRAVVAFDVASAVPAGAMIDSVQLTLTMTRTANPTARSIGVHTLLSDWGEGASNAGNVQDGDGTQALVGDATWIHTFFNTGFWTALGGAYAETPCAAVMVGDVGTYTWVSTPGLVSDVQGWLDAPATNFGWMLKGDETHDATTKRFVTREGASADRPQLTIYFTPDMVPVEPTSWGAIKALYR